LAAGAPFASRSSQHVPGGHGAVDYSLKGGAAGAVPCLQRQPVQYRGVELRHGVGIGSIRHIAIDHALFDPRGERAGRGIAQHRQMPAHLGVLRRADGSREHDHAA